MNENIKKLDQIIEAFLDEGLKRNSIGVNYDRIMAYGERLDRARNETPTGSARNEQLLLRQAKLNRAEERAGLYGPVGSPAEQSAAMSRFSIANPPPQKGQTRSAKPMDYIRVLQNERKS